MLDKRNKKLYKSLRGEYKKYARQLKNTLFDCCRDRDAVNDSLSDVLTMLAEAQTSGRAFADVIPDTAASIRETALCFPARRTRLHTAYILILSALLVILAGTAVIVGLTRPVRLDAPSPQFDVSNFTVYWQPVEHAAEYEIAVNEEIVGRTQETTYAIDDSYAYEDELHITVTAKAGGRYRDGSGTTLYQNAISSVRRVLTMEELFQNGYSSEFTYPSGVYRSIVLQLRPETNLCVRFYGTELRALRTGTLTDESNWSEPIDTEGFLFLKARVSYVIEIEPDNVYQHETVTVGIELINLLSYAKFYYPVLPEGITLFARNEAGCDPSHGLPDVSSAPDWNTAYTAQGFRFAFLESLADWERAEFMNSFVMDHTDATSQFTAFWLVENLQDEDALFSVEERIEEVDVSGRVTFSAEPGWTTYNFFVKNHLGTHPLPLDYFLLYKKGDSGLYFSRCRSGYSRRLDFSSAQSGLPRLEVYYLDLTPYETDPTEITVSVYNPNDEAVEFICDTLHTATVTVTQEMLTQGTITLQPGVTYFLNDTEYLIRTQSDRTQSDMRFFADEYPILQFPPTLLCTQNFAFQEWAYFFNPHDEPITLTLTAYSPQTF